MRTEQIALPSPAPGIGVALTVHRFGEAGARPRVYVQAALHADETPGMLVAHHLRERLAALEADGRIAGEIVLVPAANPIGLAQKVLGVPIGRFDLGSGRNFNRGYPYLVPGVAERVAGRLTGQADANVAIIREALAAEVEAWDISSPVDRLKGTLLGLAVGADIVLDLHCDAEAAMHLYTHTRMAGSFESLGALLGVHAFLTADVSGDDPFDEASSRPWPELAGRFPDHPIPVACEAATLEFRGEADVDHATARADSGALVDYMILRGIIAGPTPAVPAPLCAPTPLAASEPIVAPASGIIVFQAAIGERIEAGTIVAEIVDPTTGAVSEARTQAGGVVFARALVRFATQGQRIAKVAGSTAWRKGGLLGA
ncbi:MAG: succinylglutamate desuccinylase/aspartoacylase family protein [Microvirga sp.]